MCKTKIPAAGKPGRLSGRSRCYRHSERPEMKKLILGLAWQAMGFLGAIIILCAAAPHSWDYNGIMGIPGSLLGMELMLSLIFCAALFGIGTFFCYKGMREK